MKTNYAGHSRSNHFLVIFQSELEAIAGLAASAGAIETGGDLYGLFSHARRPVITLAVPAGPGAIHDHAHFRQDIEYTKQTSNELRQRYAIQYIGNHHSHHTLGIKGLSGGDIRSTHSIASKNGYRNMCQILVTFDGESPSRGWRHQAEAETPERSRQGKWFGKPSHEAKMTQSWSRHGLLTVHAFFYEDAMTGQPIRCPLKVIPGVSPIRKVLSSAYSVKGLALKNSYPLNRIQFDSLDRPAQPPSQEPEDRSHDAFLDHVREQAKYLPAKVKDDISIRQSVDAGIIRIPLGDSHSLILALETEPPYQIISVMIGNQSHDKEPEDITEETISDSYSPRITSVYRSAEKLISAKYHDRFPASAEDHTGQDNQNKETSNTEERRQGDDELSAAKPA